MRERGGVGLRMAPAGRPGRSSTQRQSARAARRAVYQLRRLWLAAEFSAYYGGFANEGLWPLCHMVDVRPKFRCEDWAAYQDVNARFAAAIDAGAADVGHAGLHPGLSSGARRAAPARAAAGRTHGLVLAHSMALSRSAPDLSLAAGDPRRACWPTTCWRSSSTAIAATFCSRWRRNSAPISKLTARGPVRRPRPPSSSVPIGVDYDRIQAIGSDPALGAEQQRLTPAARP